MFGAALGRLPWTAAYRRTLYRSRVDPTRTIATAIAVAADPPAAWVSGSAVGFYGDRPGEVLTEDVPGLIVPRVRPRQEQLVRAERLSALGLVDAMHPDDVTPDRLGDWLATAVTSPRPRERGVIALDGLRRVPDLIAELQPASAPDLDELQEMAS